MRRRGGGSLEAVDQPSVRAELQVLHHLFQADEVLDVDRWRVLELVCCRIEVEEMDVPSERLGVGDDGIAEGRFARAGRASNQNGVCCTKGDDRSAGEGDMMPIETGASAQRTVGDGEVLSQRGGTGACEGLVCAVIPGDEQLTVGETE